MFEKRIKLFKILGFEVGIDWSWIILAILIAWSLSVGLFPFRYKNLSTQTYWIMGIVGALGLFISIILHEICHSLVARKYGMPMKGITLRRSDTGRDTAGLVSEGVLAIEVGAMDDVPTREDPVFHLRFPISCEGVPEEILNPRSTWRNAKEYDVAALRLAEKFEKNFEKFEGQAPSEVKVAGPRLK